MEANEVQMLLPTFPYSLSDTIQKSIEEEKNDTRTTSSGSGWNSRAKLRLIEIEQVLRFLVQVSFVSQTRSLSRWLFASAGSKCGGSLSSS